MTSNFGCFASLRVQSKRTFEVKKAAYRFSQSATFYDKKFYAKLKQSVAMICTLCTVYTQTHSQYVKKMQGNIRIVLTLSILKKKKSIVTTDYMRDKTTTCLTRTINNGSWQFLLSTGISLV